MTGDYTTEQFKRDVADYTSVIEQKLRYRKLVGIAAKDRGDKDTIPELHTIFVPLFPLLTALRPTKESGDPRRRKPSPTNQLFPAWVRTDADRRYPTQRAFPS